MRAPSRWRRLVDQLLSTDPRQRTHMAMGLLALVLMVCSAVVMLMLAWAGIADMQAVAWWAVASVGGLVLMLVLMRSGATARLADPFLTLPQMAWTITSGAVAYVLAGEARGTVPAVLAMILFFGTFGLRLPQVLAIGAYALVAFGAAVVAAAALNASPWGVLDQAYALMVAIVLGGCLALNMRIQQIRAHLARKRQELARALAENRELATRDALTGLPNRRHMLELMHIEARRNARSGRALVLALLDVDHFKQINDTHGHAAGDEALRALAHTVSAAVRESDLLARWGGEEFVLMLTDTPLGDAADLLERVRCAVAALTVVPYLAAPRGITVSIGVAQQQPGQGVEQTLEQADRALYTAKRTGRDRVIVAPWQDRAEPAAAQ